MTRIDGAICSTFVAGKQVHFFVTNEHDEIQYHHVAGRFYETEELAIIAQFFPRGGVFLDIGANIGNHTIYVCNYLAPLQVIVIEPTAVVIPILKINLALNGLLPLVDLSHLGVGLSDAPGRAVAHVPGNNLGGTTLRITKEAEGLPLVRGDDLLMQRRVDFIKMDVEGMEMLALAGLAETIARWRPPMFIEVENDNAGVFREWLDAHRYVTVHTYRRYPSNENYMVVPAAASAADATTFPPAI
jgi:FkbM family methyltransferase